MKFYENWYEEKRSEYLYQHIANYENNPERKKLFNSLAKAANTQASLWSEKMRLNAESVPQFLPDIRCKIVIILLRCLGVKHIKNILAAMKVRGMSVFSKSHHENSHLSLNDTSNLRAAVFGINDGLISNMGLILGVSGVNYDPKIILYTGMAGLLAGAVSMGAGEYVSVRSQREVFEYQIKVEEQELLEYPEEEKEELKLIYSARGLSPEDASEISRILIDNPSTALNILVREELGLNPDELVSPASALIFSFLSFAAGAFLPLIPFIFNHSKNAIMISMFITLISLFTIGGALSFYTNRSIIGSGLRMTSIGVAAFLITFLIGKLVGGIISI